MYCSKCGKEIAENSSFCSNCGASFNGKSSDDKSSFGLALLGFFIPIVGFIMFLVYHKESPKRAKSAGKGAIIGFIVSIVSIIALYASLFLIMESKQSPGTGILSQFESQQTKLEKYIDVDFLEFNNSVFERGLEVKVKNICDEPVQCTVHVAAMDETGAVLGTDFFIVDYLSAGQEGYYYTFQTGTIDLYGATFEVTDIDFYSVN